MRDVHEDEAKPSDFATNHTTIELEQLIREQTGASLCFGRQVWRGERAKYSARAIVMRKESC